MMSHRILPAALLLCTLAAACGELPTATDAQAQPDGASYDGGGFGTGSGYTETEDEGTSTATTSGDNAERGGYTMGSGG